MRCSWSEKQTSLRLVGEAWFITRLHLFDIFLPLFAIWATAKIGSYKQASTYIIRYIAYIKM